MSMTFKKDDVKLADGQTINIEDTGNITVTLTDSGDTATMAFATTASNIVPASGITVTSGAGAVAITGSIHEVTTSGIGDALTLADGTAGQSLRVIYVAEGGGTDTAILTPTTFAGGATITFNALGDSADLTFSATGGWYMHGGTAVVA